MTLLLLTLVAVALYYIFLSQDFSFLRGHKNKTCPNCKAEVMSDSIVCPVCKKTLRRKCSVCGEWGDATWKFCPYCENVIQKDEEK